MTPVLSSKDFATTIARQAGEIMLKNFKLGMEKEWKEDDTPLTATDIAINQLVTDAVKKHFPDHGLIAEEGGFGEDREKVWVCDPLDGTIAFAHGLPIFSFLLALVERGNILLGVAYIPIIDWLFWAEPGTGAFVNGRRIKVNPETKFINTCIEAEWWKRANYHLDRLYQALVDRGVYTFFTNAISYTALLTAAGEFSGVIHSGEKPWDVAAVKIIVEEAGGRVTDLYGEDFRADRPVRGWVASNGLVHNELLSLVQRHVLNNK